jgi:hypothetical protein
MDSVLVEGQAWLAGLPECVRMQELSSRIRRVGYGMWFDNKVGLQWNTWLAMAMLPLAGHASLYFKYCP